MRRFPQRGPFLLEVSRQDQTSTSVVIFAKPGILSRPSPALSETTDPFAAPPHEAPCRGTRHCVHHAHIPRALKFANASSPTDRTPLDHSQKSTSHHQNEHCLLHFCNTTNRAALAHLLHAPWASHNTIRGPIGQETPLEHDRQHGPAHFFFNNCGILHASPADLEAQTGYSATAGVGAQVQVVKKRLNVPV